MIRIVPPILLAAAMLSACTAAGPIEPIPGSIIYSGQPRTKLTKAPVGSTFEHTFHDRFGRRAVETYRIEPDRSLTLVNRRYIYEDILE